MKQWRCIVCGYIHIGDRPPGACPVCGAGPEAFELIAPAAAAAANLPAQRDVIQRVLFAISCGIFIISAMADGKPNGMINNTLFQITDEPQQVLLGMDKRHLTTEYIIRSRSFAASFILPDQIQLVRRFGFQSGRETDKFAGMAWQPGKTGAPLLAEAPGFLECQIQTGSPFDAGTHLVFLARVVEAQLVQENQFLTYQLYRERKAELWQK